MHDQAASAADAGEPATPSAAQPMLRLEADDAAQAPYLSYNVPDPTSYPGRTYVELAFAPERDPFGTPLVMTPSGLPPVPVSRSFAPAARRVAPAGREPVRKPGANRIDWPGSARVSIVSPTAGASVSAAPEGTAVTVTVTVAYDGDVDRAAEVRLSAGDAAGVARRTGSHGQVERYAGTVAVRPGRVPLRAVVHTPQGDFRDEVTLEVVEVRPPAGQSGPDVPTPQVVVERPLAGQDVHLTDAGSAEVPLSGHVVDGGDAVTLTLAVDGAPPAPLGMNADRAWSTTVALTEGPHVLVVSATDRAGRTGTVSRRITVTSQAFARRRLLLVDCLRLSNFPARYGAGRVVQTMSLLPGEKTTISVRTFRTVNAEQSRTDSILESAGERSTRAFEEAVAAENSTAGNEQQSFSARVTASASASWGVASASVSSDVAHNTASAREESAKRISNATRRHAAQASSERTVSVEGKTTVTRSEEDEQSITRELGNTNLSRTLNFVFRQMTQEFVSLLHLVDVRVGMLTEWYSDAGLTVPLLDGQGQPRLDYEEATLPELRGWLQRVLGPGALGDRDANVANVHRTVLAQLDGVFDHRGDAAPVVEQITREFPVRDGRGEPLSEDDPDRPGERRPVTRAERWLRFDPTLTQTWSPADRRNTAGDASGVTLSFTVPGVILSANVVTLRTDGVVCDAFLGGGPALDVYSTQLQRTTVESRAAEADQARAEADRLRLGLDIVNAGDETKAALYRTVFAPPAPTRLAAQADPQDGTTPGNPTG